MRRPEGEPDLNRRPEQPVGRLLQVEEAIVDGRGRVRAGDARWPAEGLDMAAGAWARIAAVLRDSVPVVEARRT